MLTLSFWHLFHLFLSIAFILLSTKYFYMHMLLFSLAHELQDFNGLLITILIGGLAGFLAQVLTPGRGYGTLATIVLGIVGGWLGKILFKSLLSFTSSPLINTIICATAGALILTLLVNIISGNDKGDRTGYRA
jgi:uncharacterized membrane protein YeaQ/YmgE (transglycosylase-associated protein family)